MNINNSIIKTLFSIIIIGLFVITITPFVNASASITFPSPEARTFIFEPGKVIEMGFGIKGAANLESYVKGILANYTELIDEAQNTGARGIKVKITMPDDLPGGINLLYIGVMESAPNGVQMGGRAAAQTVIRVINLFNEPVIESKVSAKDSAIGSNSEVTVTVKSYSKNAINNIYSKIKIVDYKNKSKIYNEITTGSISLNQLEEKPLKTILPSSELKRGTYRVIAETHYGYKDEIQVKETSFRVGDNDISLNSYTSKLEEDKINKASFTIKNEWNEPINAYLELFIDDKEIGTSATKKITPFNTNNYELFVDTDKYDTGIKKGILKGYYEGKVSEFDVEFNITGEVIVATNVPKKPESALSKYKVLIIANILVVILVIINLIVILSKKKD